VKKQAFTAAFISLLIAALAMPLFVDYAAANPIGQIIPATPILSMLAPEINGVYTTTSVSLHFVVYGTQRTPQVSWFWIVSVAYKLDGVLQEQLTGYDLSREHSFILTGLSEGKHKVDVEVTVLDYYDNSTKAVYEVIQFFVDTVAPTVGLLQEETAYSSANMSLNFTLSEPVSWLCYSLDGEEAVTVTDTVVMARRLGRDEYCIMLSGLSDGSHSLTVHAKDEAGNTGASELFQFTVGQEEQPETEQTASEQPFPTTLVAVASGASLAAIATGLIVHFKKRNPAQTPDKTQ